MLLSCESMQYACWDQDLDLNQLKKTIYVKEIAPQSHSIAGIKSYA